MMDAWIELTRPPPPAYVIQQPGRLPAYPLTDPTGTIVIEVPIGGQEERDVEILERPDPSAP